MKLQKQSSRRKEDPNYEKYIKWTIVLNADRINKLGWGEGIELIDEIKENSLCLKPLDKQKITDNKEEPLYEEFKKSIKNILQRYPAGLVWAEIKDKLNYYQKAPNNKWVRNLEKDIGLIRIRKEGKMIWKLEYTTTYTVGYEGMDIVNFIKKLKDWNVELLIDIREIALSRKNGFSKSTLKEELKKSGIRYRHLRSLGSPKALRYKLRKDWDYKIFFDEYRNHIKDPEIQDAIDELSALAKSKKTVILCYEKDHKTCHRSIIAEELKKRGWSIENL
mgnify:CR=1 FL=1